MIPVPFHRQHHLGVLPGAEYLTGQDMRQKSRHDGAVGAAKARRACVDLVDAGAGQEGGGRTGEHAAWVHASVLYSGPEGKEGNAGRAGETHRRPRCPPATCTQ